MLIAVLAGALTWSLLEYLIHRFAGHDSRLLRRTPFGIELTAHPRRGDYFAPWWKKLIASRWLRDPTTGAVHPHLARNYALRAR